MGELQRRAPARDPAVQLLAVVVPDGADDPRPPAAVPVDGGEGAPDDPMRDGDERLGGEGRHIHNHGCG